MTRSSSFQSTWCALVGLIAAALLAGGCATSQPTQDRSADPAPASASTEPTVDEEQTDMQSTDSDENDDSEPGAEVRLFEPSAEFGGHIMVPVDSHVVRDKAALDALIEHIPTRKVTKKQPSPPSDDPILDGPKIDFDEHMMVVATCPTYYCKVEFVGYRHDGDRYVVVVSLPGEGENAEYYARPANVGYYRAVVVPRVDGPVGFDYRGPGQRPGAQP